MGIIERVRKLPLKKRKIILWSIVVILGFILFFFWLRSFQNKIVFFNQEKEEFKGKLNFPELKMPEIEMPEFLE